MLAATTGDKRGSQTCVSCLIFSLIIWYFYVGKKPSGFSGKKKKKKNKNKPFLPLKYVRSLIRNYHKNTCSNLPETRGLSQAFRGHQQSTTHPFHRKLGTSFCGSQQALRALKARQLCLWLPVLHESQLTTQHPVEGFISNKSNKYPAIRTEPSLGLR